MEIGQKIVFDLETWPDRENLVLKETTSEILGICHDPLRKHESKYCVRINGENYGIPFSRIKNNQ